MPTPTIAPAIVCVVETGIPASVTPQIAVAAADSAHMPPTGWSFVIFDPIVWTIRHPPRSVPSAIAACAESTTQSGTSEPLASRPFAINSARITPIVFWASFPP